MPQRTTAALDYSPAVETNASIEEVPRQAWLNLVAIAICASGNPLSQSILNVAFPALRSAFPRTPVATLSWVIAGFSIASAANVVVGAVLCGRVGARRMLTIGTVGSSIALAVCGAAPNAALLIAARIVHGAFSAMLIPASNTLVLSQFPASRRGSAIAGWSGAASVSTAAGPVLGAFLVDAWGWRWVFWANVPLALVGLALVLAFVPETERRDMRLPDLVSIPLVMVSTSGVILAISQSSRWGWTDRKTLASLACGLLFGVVLAMRNRRHERPLIDPALFRHRTVRSANLMLLLYGTPFFLVFYGLPRFTQEVWHYDLRTAGLLFLPIPITGALLANPIGRFADRHGFHRLLLIGGVCQLIGGVLAMFGLGVDRNVLLYLSAVSLLGIASSLVWPAIFATNLAGLPLTSIAPATSIQQVVQRVSVASGVATATALIGETTGPGIGNYDRVFVVVALGGVVGIFLSRIVLKLQQPDNR